jgi:serine/threonine protein kinase
MLEFAEFKEKYDWQLTGVRRELRGGWGVLYNAQNRVTKDTVLIKHTQYRFQVTSAELTQQSDMLRVINLFTDECATMLQLQLNPGEMLDYTMQIIDLPAPANMKALDTYIAHQAKSPLLPDPPKKLYISAVQNLIDGLIFMEDYGIYHGDIHPSNLYVTSNDEVRLLNFGAGHLPDRQTKLHNSPFQIPGLEHLVPLPAADLVRNDRYMAGFTLISLAVPGIDLKPIVKWYKSTDRPASESAAENERILNKCLDHVTHHYGYEYSLVIRKLLDGEERPCTIVADLPGDQSPEDAPIGRVIVHHTTFHLALTLRLGRNEAAVRRNRAGAASFHANGLCTTLRGEERWTIESRAVAGVG